MDMGEERWDGSWEGKREGNCGRVVMYERRIFLKK